MTNLAFQSYIDILQFARPYVYVFPLNKEHKIILDNKDIKDIKQWVKSETSLPPVIHKKDEHGLINLWRKRCKTSVPTIHSFKKEDLVAYIKNCGDDYTLYNIFINQCPYSGNGETFIYFYSICWTANKISWLKDLDEWLLCTNETVQSIFNDCFDEYEVKKIVRLNSPEALDVKDYRIVYHLLKLLIDGDFRSLSISLERIAVINDNFDIDNFDTDNSVFKPFKIYFSNTYYISNVVSTHSLIHVLEILQGNHVSLIPLDLFYQMYLILPELHSKLNQFSDILEIYDFNESKGENKSDTINKIVETENIKILELISKGDDYFSNKRKVVSTAVTSLGIRSAKFLKEYYKIQKNILMEHINILYATSYYDKKQHTEYSYDMYNNIFINLYNLTKGDSELLKSQLQPLKDSFECVAAYYIISEIRDKWITKNPELEELIRELF